MTSCQQLAVISVSDALVHDYLVKSGHEQIAKDFLEITRREVVPNLHGVDLKSVTSQFHLKKEAEDQVLCVDTKCTNNFVFKFLLMNGHVSVARDFKGTTQSRLKEDDHKDLHLSDVVEHYEIFNFSDRTKWVPIQEVFNDKLAQINVLDDGQSEVAKVLIYILESNIHIRKVQAEAANQSFTITHDQLKTSRKATKGIDTSRFSSIKYGATSDEFKIDLAREDLKTKAKIVSEKRLYEDLFKMAKTCQWTIAIVGCFLSKYLKTARYPQKVFMKVAKPMLFKTGSLSSEELDLISSEMSKQGKIDYTFLQDRLKRSKSDICRSIFNISYDKCKAHKGLFQLSEDTLILKYVLDDKKPQTLEEFCDIVKDISFSQLAAILNRPYESTSRRWTAYLKPIILSLFHGTLSKDLRKDIADFLIGKKVESLSQVNWDELLKEFPSCTKRYLTVWIKNEFCAKMNTNMPLYQVLAAKQLTSRKQRNLKMKRKEEVARIFDEIRGVLPMSDETKQALAGYNNL